MSTTTQPPILEGCAVLSPMRRRNGSPCRHQGDTSKAKGKPSRRRNTADRFAVLNAFVDFTAGALSRNEILVWLVLYRDTRNDTARTSQADLARRAGISDRSVRRALKGLQGRRLLKVTYRGGIGRGASAYRIYPLPPER